jgi:polar amino acid transport system substrate-binding protein
VATSADYPPFEYYNEEFALAGFDIALIQQIGERLGVQVELNDFAFDGLAAAVAADQADVAVAALSVTPEREAIADFSNVYYAGTDAVLARPEADPASLQNPAALAAARLGVQVNSIYETYAQQNLLDTGMMPKQNLYVYTDTAQAVNDLKAERLDAVWLDLKPAESYAAAGGVKILAQGLNQQLYAIGMKNGAESLRQKINEALTQLQNDGTLAFLQYQYLGLQPQDLSQPTSQPTVQPQPTSVPPTCLDGAAYVADLSYDDNNMTNPPALNPGQAFTKGWRIRNSGSCTWKPGYVMAYSSGNTAASQMGGQPIPVTQEVGPGATFDFYVNLVAPVTAGTYQGLWNLRNGQNQTFGETVWVGITVRGAATATPKPTQTSVPNITFKADRTSITAGESVLFRWTTDNAKAVYFYHDGQKWSDHAVPGDDDDRENPPYTMSYYLRVVQKNDAVVVRTILINVKPATDAPIIDYLTASPAQITIGQCVTIDWSVRGEVTQVSLLIDSSPVWDSAPVRGSYQDCPTATGARVYTLRAVGPGGTSTQQTTVNVQLGPVPEAPVIQNFTVAPTSIEPGQCVTASWTTGGGTTRIQLLRQQAVILESEQLNNSVQDCPPSDSPDSLTYTLRAYNNAGQHDDRQVEVQVAPAPPQNPLADTSWRLKTMQGADQVPEEVSITAHFGADGSLTGNSGCNSYTTTYVAGDGVITIQPPVASGEGCEDPAASLEQTYLGLLPQVANFVISGGKLSLLDNTGQEILSYKAAG